MSKEINEKSKPSSLDELIDAMEKQPDKYKHLQIFLRHENFTGGTNFGEEFLVVASGGFALYRMNSIDYEDGSIILSLTESLTQKPVLYSVDIYNRHPNCYFIRWKDVKQMVFNECLISNVNDKNLLELIS